MVSSKNPAYRRPLNNNQLEVLELLYKFRFGTSELIAQYFGKKNGMFVYNRLQVLVEQELIGKRHDSSYRIKGKPAAYYLLPAGARKLGATREPDEQNSLNIKGIYKDKSVSESFIEHCLAIFAAYNQLSARYSDSISFFTRTDLANYDHFPQPLPDALLSLEVGNGTKHLFLNIIEDRLPFFTLVRRIQQYIKYEEAGQWEEATETKFPAAIFICESASLQKRLQKQIVKAVRNSSSDISFATTTKAELIHIRDDESIWQPADDPDTQLPLGDIY
jgi:type II secretory ATPase GspE/PulE/Tfp pilus assembly ATPase PilB-like protein